PSGRSGPAGSSTAGNDSTLVGLSLPRYRALSRRLSAGPTTRTPNSRPAAFRPNAVPAQVAMSERVGAHFLTVRWTSTDNVICFAPRRPELFVAPMDGERRRERQRT